jgi:cytidine deaminase
VSLGSGIDQKAEVDLRDRASEARPKAYAPYSGYYCGCAVLSASGKIYTGTNVENSSYRLTVCAEQNAVTAMVASGDLGPIVAVAVAGKPGDPCVPCGACRQTIIEFGPEAQVYFLDTGSVPANRSIKELLPNSFELLDLRRDPGATPTA